MRRLLRLRRLLLLRPLLFVLPLVPVGADEPAASPVALTFAKGPSREIVANVYENISAVELSEATIEAKLISVGKAAPLSNSLLARLKEQDRRVYNQATKIHTALRLQQENKEFYLRAFPSIALSDLQPGQNINCRVVLMSIRTPAATLYLPLIRTATVK